MPSALYTGTFDPPTSRHVCLVANGFCLCDRIVVAVTRRPATETMFTTEERLEIWRQIAGCIHPERVEVVVSEGQPLTDLAQQHDCRFVLRRMPTAEEYEKEMAIRTASFHENRSIRFVYLVPDPELVNVTSSMVRGTFGTPGWVEAVKPYVEVATWEALLDKRMSRPAK